MNGLYFQFIVYMRIYCTYMLQYIYIYIYEKSDKIGKYQKLFYFEHQYQKIYADR